jgi:hypothetical protein
MILLFLDPQFDGYAFTSGLQITVNSIHRQSIWAYVSPLSVLRPGSLQVENFSAQVGNRTRAHGDESNPLEISMSSAMKGLTTLGALLLSFMRGSPVTETCVKRGSNRGQGPIRFLLLYRGSSPFTHCATSAGLRHQCRYCATSASTAPPVPVLRHQCGFCATSAGSAPPVPVLRHQCRYCATSAGTAPPVPVLRHQCRCCATSAGNYPFFEVPTQSQIILLKKTN